MSEQESVLRCAVILTAIPVEYQAVHAHLTTLREELHPQGTIYERGTFSSPGQSWDVVIGEIGAGNPTAALEAERAIHYFRPSVILFVGVAGGRKDVKLGDVVAATKVYGYESGKAETVFLPRPSLGHSTYRMEQRARAEARKSDWLQRCKGTPPARTPTVYVAPIAAGEKIVASTRSHMAEFLQAQYGDALAVEMEGYGFLQATHANPQVEALVIRGISDLLDGKQEADAMNFQELAAQHASAFAFEILAKLEVSRRPKPLLRYMIGLFLLLFLLGSSILISRGPSPLFSPNPNPSATTPTSPGQTVSTVISTSPPPQWHMILNQSVPSCDSSHEAVWQPQGSTAFIRCTGSELAMQNTNSSSFAEFDLIRVNGKVPDFKTFRAQVTVRFEDTRDAFTSGGLVIRVSPTSTKVVGYIFEVYADAGQWELSQIMQGQPQNGENVLKVGYIGEAGQNMNTISIIVEVKDETFYGYSKGSNDPLFVWSLHSKPNVLGLMAYGHGSIPSTNIFFSNFQLNQSN